MPSYDTTGYLLPSVKQRGLVPTAQSTFLTADILRILNEEQLSSVVPLLLGVREEYFVKDVDTALVAGTSEYAIPTRAMGGQLRDVVVLQADGTTRNLERQYPEAVVGASTDRGAPHSFTLRGNTLVVLPTPIAPGETLRMSIQQRPGYLVETVATATVTSINTGTGVVTASGGVPSSMSTTSPVDFVRAKPGFECLGQDVTPTGKAATTLTIALASLPSSLAVGDYVCLAGEAPVAQLPVELHPVLVLRGVSVLLKASGDMEGSAAALKEAQEKEGKALTLLSERVKGEQRKISNGFAKWRGAWSG